MRARPFSSILLLLVLGLSWPRPATPCSSFAFLNNGMPVFGANYDNPFAPGQLFITRRGVRKSGWAHGTTGRVAHWVSRYGSVAISCAGYQIAWGGMNEAGLVFSTMQVGGAVPPADERPPLAGAVWWQYMLDTCATIEDVREAAEHVRISDTLDHYLVADRTGAVAVVECLDGKLVIRSGSDLPVRALTNRPYQVCLDHVTSRAPDPEEPYDSLSRFSRLAAGTAPSPGRSTAAAVDHAFELLANVAGSNTRWSFVCDTANLVFHLKSYRNPRVRSIDLRKIDFSCANPTAVLDAHADLAGDITAAFHDYSHREAEAHMLRALAHFRPDMEPDAVRRLLAHFESFTCDEGVAPAPR